MRGRSQTLDVARLDEKEEINLQVLTREYTRVNYTFLTLYIEMELFYYKSDGDTKIKLCE